MRTSPVREGIIEDCTPRDPHPVSRHPRPARSPSRRTDGLVPSEQNRAPGSIAGGRGRLSGGPQSPPSARPNRRHPPPTRCSRTPPRCLAACSTPARWRARPSVRLSQAPRSEPAQERTFGSPLWQWGSRAGHNDLSSRAPGTAAVIFQGGRKSRRAIYPRPDPRHRLVLAHLETRLRASRSSTQRTIARQTRPRAVHPRNRSSSLLSARHAFPTAS